MINGYSIFKTDCSTVFGAVVELLSGIDSDMVPLRLVFFAKIADNTEYVQMRSEVLRAVESVFGAERPMVSLVAQAPLDCAMSLEMNYILEGTDVEFKYAGSVRYALVGRKYLMTEGILPSSLDIPMRVQADEVFSALGSILSCEGIPVSCIDRQWNYIENIVGEKTPGLQNYQQLNDARSYFYSGVDWKYGYPAATGIGTQAGGIMVEVIAAADGAVRRIPIDNTLQVAAHAYSSDVLVGETETKTTPKFERAKAVVGDSPVIYVSGTAAIRGEMSLTGVGIEKQTVITLENIENLFSKDTLERNDIDLDKELFVSNFRVYLKYADDFQRASEIVSEKYPGVPAVYVLSDVCRDELLIEIECIVNC